MKVIDACAFHEWSGTTALTPYMSAEWRTVLERSTDPSGPVRIKSQTPYVDPRGKWAEDAVPNDGEPGSSVERLREQLLDGQVDRVVLGYEDGLLATAVSHHYLACVVARAANDWTRDAWLARDERLYGLVLVATVLPEAAADEIRRAGQDSRMVGVALGANGLGRPFGHPAYHPIYEAAAELHLPIVIQAAADSATDASAAWSSGGTFTTFGEHRAFASHSLMAHLASLIVQGVFEKHPDLRVLAVGGGAGWIPAFLWRLDYWFNVTRAQEAPWLRRLPSEYFLDHVRVGFDGPDIEPDSETWLNAIETYRGVTSTLTYASGYPQAGWRRPDAVAGELPERLHAGLLAGNAHDLYRWPAEVAAATVDVATAEE